MQANQTPEQSPASPAAGPAHRAAFFPGCLIPVKYPPSIAFTLLTVGANLAFLGAFGWISERRPLLLKPLAVFGRTPLFFYITHLFLYLGVGLWLAPQGTSIAAMYPVWLLGLLVLFPLCLGYGWLRRRRPADLVLQFL